MFAAHHLDNGWRYKLNAASAAKLNLAYQMATWPMTSRDMGLFVINLPLFVLFL